MGPMGWVPRPCRTDRRRDWSSAGGAAAGGGGETGTRPPSEDIPRPSVSLCSDGGPPHPTGSAAPGGWPQLLPADRVATGRFGEQK
uniref:Predicted protein n=1 Tax=Hordeum vulgare subsp. vulgare TaxID=112509 RepID=F2DM58_HORVV|nr:predicted protein [Hordeum vulgare subsp. vulgare]